MKNIRSHFVFSRSQQNGIFLLVIIILVLQGIIFFPFSSDESSLSDKEEAELLQFQKKIDSLKELQAKKELVALPAFNPNFITDFKGYTLGMSVEEIDRLLDYRAQGKWVNSTKEFKEVTKVSDSLLNVISPYFKFSEWTQKSKVKQPEIKKAEKSTVRADLNLVTSSELKEINGVGDVLAERIVKYRAKINGFRSLIQLKDIYGLNQETRDKLENKFTVLNSDTFNRKNINTAKVLELAEIPYLNYELAREIIDYRQLHEEIHSFEELAKIKAFPSEKIDRIALYLTLK
jgi:competence protein ComEA